MKLQISDLTTERQWRAAIGADQARFAKLLGLFTASYRELFGHSRGTAPSGPRSDPEFAVRTGVTILHLVQLEGGLNL